jgi:hypothetical protein
MLGRKADQLIRLVAKGIAVAIESYLSILEAVKMDWPLAGE